MKIYEIWDRFTVRIFRNEAQMAISEGANFSNKKKSVVD